MTQPDLSGLIEAANSLQPNTKRSYKNAVRLWLEFAGTDPRSWTVATAQAFYDDLITRTSVQHANGVVTGGLAFALRRAVALEWSGVRDVTVGVDKKKVHGEALDDDGDPDGGRALTPAEAGRLLAACNGPELNDQRDRAIVTVGLYTGMRRMSLVDASFARMKVTPLVVMLNVLIKGGSRYNVPLAAAVWDGLGPYFAALGRAGGSTAASGALFPPIGQRRPTAKDPIGQVTVYPRHMSTDALRKTLRARADQAGIPDFHPHMLRHTFSTWTRLAEVPNYLIETITGHQGGKSIIDRVYFDRGAAVADAVDKCYAAITAQLAKA